MDTLELTSESQGKPEIEHNPRSSVLSLSDKSFLQVRDMFPSFPIHHNSYTPG
jgi:hypothetical protein